MTRKGKRTREAIVDVAMRMASMVGLEGLSIGTLASTLGISKSGLFGHFQSKENLQLAVLDAAEQAFVEGVVQPAVAAPRGLPRVRAMLERWLVWARSEGGCLFVSASAELDDRPGVVRDHVVDSQRRWSQTLARAARIAVDEGHLTADTDADQLAFELYSLMLGAHHYYRLLGDPATLDRVERGFAAILARVVRDDITPPTLDRALVDQREPSTRNREQH